MATLTATLIGNSGFEYTKTDKKIVGGHKRVGWKYGHTVTVKNIKTGIVLFTLKGGVHFNPYSTPYTEDKKFLGLDDKYYYIIAKSNYTADWGQIQSDGAVLRSDRTILTVLPFFPHYEDPVTIVSPETPIIVKEPPNIPKVVVISPTPIKTPIKQKVSWIQKIINWIIAILNR